MNIRSSFSGYPTHSPYFGKIVAIQRFDFLTKDMGETTLPEKIAFMKQQVNDAKDEKYGIPGIATGYATTLETDSYFKNDPIYLVPKREGVLLNKKKEAKGEAWIVFTDSSNDWDLLSIRSAPATVRKKLKSSSKELGGLRRIGPSQVKENKFSFQNFIQLMKNCIFASSTNTFHSLHSQSSK